MVGVAFLHVDVVCRDAQLLRDDLGEGGLVALPLGLHPELQHRLAGRMDAQLGGVEHAQAGDVVLLALAGSDHLRETGDADSHQLTACALLRLLAAQLVISDLLQCQSQCARIVTAVVLPAGGGVVREGLGSDEVPQAQLGGVDAQLDGGVLDEAFDQVRGLGDTERTAVGDTAGRLVRVGAVGDDVRCRDVVRPGDDVKETRLEPARLRVGEEGPVVAQQHDAKADEPIVRVDRELAGHVIVARESGRDEVLGAILDPLDRTPQQQRRSGGDDVARIDRNLVAEAASDVRGDDADLLFGQAGHQGEQGAMGVRGLAGHVQGRLAGGRVDVGDDAAGLQRRRMAAWVMGRQPHDARGAGEGRLGGLLVARLPVVDVVGVRLVVADDRCVGAERLLRGGHRRQRLVVDLDQCHGVLGDVAGVGDDRGDLLSLEAHLVGGQHGLGVAAQSRHPGELVLGQELTGDHGDDTGERRRRTGVDAADARVRVGAAQDCHVEHAGQHHVVDVGAPAADEACVLLASDGFADASQGRWCHRHHATPAGSGSGSGSACGAGAFLAAYRIALTMFM